MQKIESHTIELVVTVEEIKVKEVQCEINGLSLQQEKNNEKCKSNLGKINLSYELLHQDYCKIEKDYNNLRVKINKCKKEEKEQDDLRDICII